MKLEQIGFYTLSDERAKNTSPSSNLKRCELIITDRCNFSCPYCRGLKKELRGDISITDFCKTLGIWVSHGLENIRLSGGEPTLHPYLPVMVELCKTKNINRIAISTNGSADFEQYVQLVRLGMNDVSVSLDACCSSTGDIMAGKTGQYDKVIKNIGRLANIVYVTVGVVVTDKNLKEVKDIVETADRLGVADIRIIPAAQYSKCLDDIKIKKSVLDRHPILKYRVQNHKPVRGLCRTDCKRCYLAMDDMAVAGNKQFPCIIYMREQGEHIGYVNAEMRGDRIMWVRDHNSIKDPICKNNCLDVCRDYNNKVDHYVRKNARKLF